MRADGRARAVPRPARLGPSRRPARAVRRHRARRRLRAPDRRRHRRGVVGVRARHRPAAPRPARARWSSRRAPTAATSIPRLDDLPEGASARDPALHADRLPPRPRRLAQRSPVSRPGARAATSASAAAACASSSWQPQAATRRARGLPGRRRPGSHRPPRGSCRRPRSSWRGRPADRGEPAAEGGAPGAPAVATTAAPLDVSKLLTDDEIRGVTGYVGKFEDGKLTDLPTTEFYDSRHFKAVGKPESYDVGLRVWRLGTAAAEVQYRKLMSTLPEAKTTDEVGDASFRARSSGIAALVYLVRERGVVVSMTCGGFAVHRARAAREAGEAGRIAAPRAAARARRAASPPARARAGGEAVKARRASPFWRRWSSPRWRAGRARLRSRDDARRVDRARGARLRAAPRAGARAVAAARAVRADRAVARPAADGPGADARGAAGRARSVGRLHARAGRRRARAGVGDRRVGHRDDAGRARPGLLLRPEPRLRAVAGGRARVARKHAGLLLDDGRRVPRASSPGRRST